MFERLKDRIGTALDCLVEFSTLGEYRLPAPADGPAIAPPPSSSHGSGLGGRQLAGATYPEVAPARAGGGPACRTVAVGAIGTGPVVTPAARRRGSQPARRRRQRPGVPRPVPQPCLKSEQTALL
jgi:hypothetical protein